MTRNIFLYGTLRDPGQLRAVLGHDDWTVTEGTLDGHAVLRDVKTGSFPVLVADESAAIEGRVLSASNNDLRRLDWYEAVFGYERRPVRTAEGLEVDVYFPGEEAAAEGNWSLDHWVSEWGAVVEEAARSVMAGYPGLPPGEMARRYPRILARAATRVRASRATSGGGLRRGTGRKGVVEARALRRHEGFFALDELHLDHRRFDGGREEVVREVFVSTDATLVLPYDPGRDEVVLVEQFRAGTYRRGDPNPWCLEPVAGLIDPGETPQECAHREAMEEAHLTLSTLVPVPGGYPSPGATTEFYFLFIGLCDLSSYRPVAAGQADEGEDILTQVLPLETCIQHLSTGELEVLPLAYLLTWTAANRARLRAAAGH